MWVAKLCTGQIVELHKFSVPVAFNQTRHDWCLVSGPVNLIQHKRHYRWVKATQIVWRIPME